MTTTLTGKNQVTVPAGIARRFGLAAGTQFEWGVGDQPNQIILTIRPTRKQLLERVRRLGRKAKRPGVEGVAEFVQWRNADDQLRQNVLK